MGIRYDNTVCGLSPLARGTRQVVRALPPEMRFIPAGAGNTVPRWRRYFLSPVYPRWRGEHSLIRQLEEARAGLSPLARGTHFFTDFDSGKWRFIPAGAGNTTAPGFSDLVVTVYPRWRGEHSSDYIGIKTLIGLSPLARGTRERLRPGERV